MNNESSVHTVSFDDDYHVGYTTPTRDECRIPSNPPCPPPLKRKRSFYFGKKKRKPPINGYFQPPDLDMFFSAKKAALDHVQCNWVLR
ncbi:unnamed protein product [Cochlearia groenlandica]